LPEHIAGLAQNAKGGYFIFGDMDNDEEWVTSICFEKGIDKKAFKKKLGAW